MFSAITTRDGVAVILHSESSSLGHFIGNENANVIN